MDTSQSAALSPVYTPVACLQKKSKLLFPQLDLSRIGFFFLTRGIKYIDLLFLFKYFILASYFNVASGQQKVSDIESTPKEYHCSFLLQFSSFQSLSRV